MDNVAGEELEWDLRDQRIETIGQLVAYVRDAQMTAATEKTVDALQRYLTAIQGMFQDVRQNVKRQTNVDVDGIDEDLKALDRRLDNESAQGDVRQIYNDLLDIENRVQDARVEAGLDIPVKQKLEYGQKGDHQGEQSE